MLLTTKLESELDDDWLNLQIIFMRLGAGRSRSFPETQYYGTGLCLGCIHAVCSLIRHVAQGSCGTALISLWQNQFPDIDFLKEELSNIAVVIWNVNEKSFRLFMPIKKWN